MVEQFLDMEQNLVQFQVELPNKYFEAKTIARFVCYNSDLKIRDYSSMVEHRTFNP